MKTVYARILLLVGVLALLTVSTVSAQASEKDVARKFFDDLWSQGKLETAFKIVAPSYQFHHPMIQIVGPAGPELINGRVSNLRGSFSDLKFTIEDMIAEGDKVAVRWLAKGTHDGALGETKPTGKPISYSGITVLKIRGGQIYEEWSVDTFASVLRELGITQLRINR